MVDGQAGKGDKYRKVDFKKWDEGWESAFGEKSKKKNPKKGLMQPGGVIDFTDIPPKEKEKDNE
tara:strand:- start:1786 stop:1977 length:192 start_codon:yes stop_codon:yes gene_type:complete